MGLCALIISYNSHFFLFFFWEMIALFALPGIIIESTAKV